MLSHAVPNGDDAAVLDRALTALLVELAKKKFADTRPRKSRGCADDSDISAAVKRVVWVRDRGRCTYVGSSGHRCEERRFVQFHHGMSNSFQNKSATAARAGQQPRADGVRP
jgi:hypothetical protein